MNSPTTHLSPLISKDAIQLRVSELGAEISRDYAGLELVCVGVLTGASLFLSDLIRNIELKMEVEYVAASSYGKDTSSSGEVRLLKDLSHPIENKHVLLVEDIVDTGTTLHYLTELLKARHPASLEICTLLDKPSRRRTQIDVKYLGFTIEDLFVIGYGLDYAGKYRNLPYIAHLQEQ